MSDNKQRREEAKRTLEKELNSRQRSEKMKPVGVVLTAALAIIVIVGGIVFATKYNKTDDSAAQTQAAEPTTSEYLPLATTRTTALGETVSCEYPAAGEASKEISAPKTDDVSAVGTVGVTLETSAGPIPLTLDRSVSPCTVNAIEHMVSVGYYDDTVCHRLTTSGIHVLQCGDPSGTGAGGPGFNFANEFPTDEADEAAQNTPVVYQRGTIAMANAGLDTNGSQFFLNYGDSPLPPMYTYFGQIAEEGLATLDTIAAAGVAEGATDGAPATEVKITKATLS